MDEWALVLGGGVMIAALALVALLGSRSGNRSPLLRPFGPRRSGAYGVLTRRDLVRYAVYSLGVAALLMGVSLGAYAIAQHLPNESKRRFTVESYFFISFILSGLACVLVILALIGAALWRPRRVAATPERVRTLAQYLRRMRTGELPYGAWRDLSAIRFDVAAPESIRREVAARVGSRPRELSDEDALWLRGVEDQLLDRAV